MEVTGNGSNKDGDGRQEGKEAAKKQNVTMGMEVLDCPVCSYPLRPPIFQVVQCISRMLTFIQIMRLKFLCQSVYVMLSSF